MVSNQRMTSAPAASSFRQQFQDRGRISEYDASVSRKDGQHGNRHGLLHALPAGKEPLEEGSTLGRWSITIDCMGLWLATRIQQSLIRVLVVEIIKLINVALLAKLAQIPSKALRISPKSQTS